MTLTLIPISSSNIHSAGYDPETRVMRVRFRDYVHKNNGVVQPGRVYEHLDVSPEAWRAFMAQTARARTMLGMCAVCMSTGGWMRFGHDDEPVLGVCWMLARRGQMMAASKPERRLRSETVTFHLNAGTDEAPALHTFDVQLAFDGKNQLREVAFVSRGKIGHGLDILFSDLGVKLSRAIQGRDPDTGDF